MRRDRSQYVRSGYISNIRDQPVPIWNVAFKKALMAGKWRVSVSLGRTLGGKKRMLKEMEP